MKHYSPPILASRDQSNETACCLLEYGRAELVSLYIQDLDPSYDLARWMQHWEDARQRRAFVFETTNRTKRGRFFPVKVSLNYLEFECEASSCSVFRDISERKQAEEVQRQYLHRLQLLSRQLVEAQEVERTRIARELHDEIAQALALIKLNIGAVQRLAGASPLAPPLEQSLGIIEQTLQRVRTLALDLRPAMLDDFGLVATLRWYLDRLAHLAGWHAEVLAEPFAASVPQHIEIVCFRVVQEALSNTGCPIVAAIGTTSTGICPGCLAHCLSTMIA